MRNVEELRLTVDNEKATRSLVYSPELERMFPDLPANFQEIDNCYEAAKTSTFQQMAENRFRIMPHAYSVPADASVIYDSVSAASNSALLVFAPFSDVAPRSRISRITDYVQKEKPNIIDIQRAQPHSWSQSTKSLAIHNLLELEGHPMPVITVFGPMPMSTFSLEAMKRFSRGDFHPSARIATRAFRHVQDLLHGPRSETQLETRHYYGMSLGASHAVGSAAAMSLREGSQVGSVTAQELILGPKNIVDLLRRFTVNASVGEPSAKVVPAEAVRIPEIALRKEVDAHGNELAMFPQMANSMLKLTYLNGLTHTEWMVSDLETLVENDVPVTIARAENSGLTAETLQHVKGVVPKRNIIRVEAVAGQKAEHLINEHVTASAAIALIGISRARR